MPAALSRKTVRNHDVDDSGVVKTLCQNAWVRHDALQTAVTDYSTKANG